MYAWSPGESICSGTCCSTELQGHLTKAARNEFHDLLSDQARELLPQCQALEPASMRSECFHSDCPSCCPIYQLSLQLNVPVSVCCIIYIHCPHCVDTCYQCTRGCTCTYSIRLSCGVYVCNMCVCVQCM